MSGIMRAMWEYRARVLAVVDGDTIDLLIDLGLEIQTTQRIRVVGLNAPEKNTAAGKAAKAWVEQWVAPTETSPIPNWFTVRTVKDRREKFGRYLGDLVRADGASLSADLLAAGHALPWNGEGSRPV